MDVGPLITRYAARFCRVHADAHSVSSPLGAWMILALAAPLARQPVRDELEDVLGASAQRARRALDDLLADPPDVLHAALAVWGVPEWAGQLPSVVQTGQVPNQAQADAWARDHTDGMIDRFPVEVSDMTAVLASALATRIHWLRPYAGTDAAELRSPWSSQVEQALTLAGADGFLTDGAEFGAGPDLLAVHSASDNGSLRVVSVIGARGVSYRKVLSAAHEIARREATGSGVRRHALSELPVGDGAFWTIVEERRAGGDQVRVVLPAWQTSSNHDLTADAGLGFAALGRTLPVPDIQARQSAVARYGRWGFEAAAITAVAQRSAMPSATRSRTAILRFGHPYAVVAVTSGRRRLDPWAGVPVFAAWVAEPAEVSSVSTH